jgi:hypothetical protein
MEVRNRAEIEVADPPAGRLRILAAQRRGGRPQRTATRWWGWPAAGNDAVIGIEAEQDGAALAVERPDARLVWSGMSWGAGRVTVRAGRPLRIRVRSREPQPVDLEIQVLAEP